VTWLPEQAPGATALDRVFGLLPAAYDRFRELYGALWDEGGLDPAALELARLRIAHVVGATGEAAVRFARDTYAPRPGQVAALPAWPTSPEFSPLERAVIGFAEQYALDPHELRDHDFDALRAVLDEPRIAALVLVVAMFDAVARFRTALGADPGPDDPRLAPAPTRASRSLP
jgi:alkylhydroperoxidase family enzyme